MGLLNRVMGYFSKPQFKSLPELQVCVSESSPNEGAIVAAIVAALHHHELETSGQNNDLAGLAALVAAIHHHKNTKK